MHHSSWLRVVGALAAFLTVLTAIFTAGAAEPAPGPFYETWARTDLPAQSDEADHT